MKIRLIASDLDGTLLRDGKEVSPLTKEAVGKAVQNGIRFVPATGRALQTVPKEVLALPGVDYVITSNGAAVYSVLQKKRIYECLLERESVEKILEIPPCEEYALEAFVDGVPYAEEAYVKEPKIFGATDFGEAYVRRTRNIVGDIRQFIREHADCLDSISFVSGNGELRKKLKGQILSAVPGVYVTSSVDHMLEIGNQEAGKGKTLLHLLEILGISPREAMAFGDADNDIDMLQAAGCGVAMGNASELCKASADRITDTNENDGAAKIILEYLSEVSGGEDIWNSSMS